MVDVKVWENFPAAFHPDILKVIDGLLGTDWEVLDPFAGTGRIHELRPRVKTFGVEIEPEGAAMSRYTRCGDATHLPRAWTGRFRAVACSPTYASRMADHHDAKEKCKPCGGTGMTPNVPLRNLPGKVLLGHPCSKCDGTGKRKYKRFTYKHSLGRDLHPRNTGGMQWSEKDDAPYKVLHREAWAESWRVLQEGGLLIVNVKNHIRKYVEIDVVGWHAETIKALGFEEVERIPVKTPGMGFGANRDARAECEYVLVFRKPVAP